MPSANSAPLILIVEDSATQAKQVAAYLSGRNVDVVIASDGAQALRLVTVHDPDLIILDINLPKMDGYQVCRRLKRDPATAQIPIIMLTSAMEASDRLRGIAAGAIEYIPKDQFAIEYLLNALETLNLLEPSE